METYAPTIPLHQNLYCIFCCAQRKMYGCSLCEKVYSIIHIGGSGTVFNPQVLAVYNRNEELRIDDISGSLHLALTDVIYGKGA